MKIFDNLTQQESKTFKLHLFYNLIEGIAAGSLILTEFVFLKSMKGSNVHLAFLFQLAMVVFLFSMVANEILRRYSNRKKLLRITAIISKLPLVGLSAFPKVDPENGLPTTYHYIFLIIFLLYYISKIAVIPSINQYLKGNYRKENIGRLFSFSVSVQKSAAMVATFFVGLMLDLDANAYRVYYPIVGILAVISVFQLTKIDYVNTIDEELIPIRKSIGHSFKRMYHILISNKPFQHLEIGFMIYGFAWMSTHAVITIFYERELGLNYSSVAFYKNAFNLVAIVFLPFFGRIIEKKDPRRFGLITFSSLLLFILFTMLTEYYPLHFEIQGIKIYVMLMVAVFFNGIFMGSMPILWGIGSSYFCKPNQAADYQSVHLFLTGSRALFAPLIGIKLYEVWGYSTTFTFGIILLIAALSVLIFSEKKFPIKN